MSVRGAPTFAVVWSAATFAAFTRPLPGKSAAEVMVQRGRRVDQSSLIAGIGRRS